MKEADLVQMLNTTTRFRFLQSKACRVTMAIAYSLAAGNVNITFGEAPYGRDNHFSIVTWFPLDKQRGSIFSEIDFVCSTFDLCDRTFLTKRAQELVNTIDETYKYRRIDPLASSRNSDKCDVFSQSVNCPSGMCSASYDAANSRTSFQAECMANASAAALRTSVKIHGVGYGTFELDLFEYTRMMKKCNSEVVSNRTRQRMEILCGPVPTVAPRLPSTNGTDRTRNPPPNTFPALHNVLPYQRDPKLKQSRHDAEVKKKFPSLGFLL